MPSPGFPRQLEDLRLDFQKNTGSPFEYFYCPILYLDEKTELCEAHVVCPFGHPFVPPV
jgi:hypothetical protein